MCRMLCLLTGLLLVSAAAYLGQSPTTCLLKLELIDADTGEPLPGVVQVLGQDGELIELDGLINRGEGLARQDAICRWWVLPKRSEVTVPSAPLVVWALAGLETDRAEAKIDLSGKQQAELRIGLKRFYRARQRGYVAGNTHLHLQKMSKQQADRYLREVPLVDGTDLVFVSYLERAKADLEYTTNNYTREDLQRLSDKRVQFGHGEEHRHNFGSGGEGYGHILLLDIPTIIHPVSIGPGITLKGTDAPPMQQGIDRARRDGGKVVWAHNMFGHEDIPNWLTGRVDANNIFDGGTRGSYKESFYRYLNAGLHVPFSTGTDWFIYDFSRVYVMTDRPVTPNEWLELLRQGKSYITNGPLLDFTVDHRAIGDVIELSEPRELPIRARAVGRVDFGRIELVQNGQVVATVAAQGEAGHFTAEMDRKLKVTDACWLALRTPPPPVSGDPALQAPVANNEYGKQLFAHTSPIYVNVAGKGVFDTVAATRLLEDMQASLKAIEQQATFADDSQRRRVNGVYHEAMELLQKRLDQ